MNHNGNYRILFSNIGYATGINGCAAHHLFYSYRHFYCPPFTQRKVLVQLGDLIEKTDPDLCCFAEISQQSFLYGGLNQLAILAGGKYPFFDIENKYAENSWLRSLMLTKRKSNAFMSKINFPYKKIYFESGFKRLIYEININKNITLFFAHFSLKKSTRRKQLLQARQLFSKTKGEIIFLGDFNILGGIEELRPLLHQGNLALINDPDRPTFIFHKSTRLLDLCICTKGIAPYLKLDIHPQPYSDHAALILEIKNE